ncbi:MAG TPA: hypothetical protein VNT50_03370 [Microbacterium sp.]|uniref:hypothetical protein n=1 Tax=Microbacterium sp. TaxID=51671 RepID=UPI002D01790E|nr:hypothetical protein [Microbacterium sp.]HWI30504.1 hypothetical protein [Microbacterium sp.]
MTRSRAARRGILSFFAPLAIAGVLLTGCAGATELSRETAAQLQSGVVAVAESAASGDPAGALARLDELQAALATELAAGGVSERRAADIQAAIEAVRADLQQATAPVVPVEPTAPAGDDGADDDNSDPGGNNDGNGNGNDNGNGNGSGKDKDKRDE